MKTLLRSVWISSSGNLLEWYDFGLCFAFANVFAKLFFPHTTPALALIEIFGVYALGFVARPIGSFIFGSIGDRFGRIKTLKLTLSGMALPTLLIACLPSYDRIGIAAPILLITLRFIQGISLGGEYTGIIVYLTESAPPKKRALYASLAGTFANIGLLLATAVAIIFEHLFSPSALSGYGWRLAFVFGGIIGGVIFLRQRQLSETPEFQTLLRQKTVSPAPIRTVFKTAKRPLLLVVSLVIFNAVFYYTCFVYLGQMLHQFGLNTNRINALQIACLAAMVVLVPLGGKLCDHFGRRKSFIFVTASVALLVWPCFWALASGKLALIIVAMVIFTLLSSFEQGTTSVLVAELFHTEIRQTGLSISYNVTQALFGGTAPLFAAWLTLVTHSPLSPANYLLLVSIISLTSAVFWVKKTPCITRH